jgi:hypothetical protein
MHAGLCQVEEGERGQGGGEEGVSCVQDQEEGSLQKGCARTVEEAELCV